MLIIKDTSKAEELFKGCDDSSVWSCLQGTMGEIIADSEEKPESAMAHLGDFFFVTGRPDEELIRHVKIRKPDGNAIIVPVSGNWEPVIKRIYEDSAEKITRYAIKKEPDVFDRKHLEKIVEGLPDGFGLRQIDERIYNECKKETWSEDFVIQYDTYEKFHDMALGIVIMHNGLIVSGASSYSSYNGGIEVEIDTRKEYRRRGLAAVCGAALVLSCLDRKLYPSWDAANMISVRIAEKLGYHFDREYTAYEVN